MTTAGQREDRFGDITKVRALGTRFYAMSGERNTVIVASNVANVATVVGETVALGSDARDIASNGTTQLYILTDLGLQVATLADTPVLGTKHAFNPGTGRWVIYSGGYVFAPAPGGLRVIDPALGEVSQSTAYGVADIALARLTSDGLIYGIDQKRAKIHVWRIVGNKAKYISSYAAYNCRDVVQVLIDETAHILFVQCKHRIVGFNIPSSGAVDDAITVTLRQDYGKLAEDYTDFVKIGTNKYWTGVNADSPLNAGSSFLGRTFADWDVTNQAMVAAFPDMAVFATSDVTPYVGENLIPVIPEIIPPPAPPRVLPPPVIPPPVAPLAPVITSALTTGVTEDTLLSYTITATGAGPIYYDLGARPSWVTSINHTTGVVLGIPPDPGAFNITITATNAGGTDTKILVVTANLAIGDNTAVYTNNPLNDLDVDVGAIGGALVYICGGFTSVTDRNGTYTRNRLACLNASTGLWTSWNPDASGSPSRIHIHTDGTIVVAGGAASATVGGVSVGWLYRLSAASGAVLSAPSQPDAVVNGMASSGTDLYITGGFGSVGGQSRGYIARLSNGGTLDSWDPQTAGGVKLNAQMFSVFPSGSGVYVAGQGGISSPAGLMFGVALIDASTGIIGQMTRGGATNDNIIRRMFTANGGVVVPTTMFQVQNLPALTLFSSQKIPTMVGTDISGSIGPAFTGPDQYKFVVSGMQRSDGTLLFGSSGGWTSINGDSSILGMAAVTTSGATVSGFTYASRFTGAPSPKAQVMKRITDSAIVVSCGSVSTYDGTTATGILIINPYTGARY